MNFKLIAGGFVAGMGMIFLIGCGAKGPASFDADAYNKDKTKTAEKYVQVTNPKALKKAGKKVVIPTFQVEFINSSSASSSSYSPDKNGSASVHVTYNLKGVDTAVFQSITDSLYNVFTAGLRENGFDVVSKDVMIQDTLFKNLIASGEGNPSQQPSRLEGDCSALVFAPTGMVVHYTNFNPKVSLKSLFGGFKGNQPENWLGQIMEKDGASLVAVQMVVGFAQLKDSHSTGSGNAVVSSQMRFSIAPKHTEMALVPEGKFDGDKNKKRYTVEWNKGAVLNLQKPIFSSGGFSKSIVDATSTGTKVAEGVGNAISVLGALAGGGSTHTSKSRIYDLNADADAYKGLANTNLGFAEDMLLVSMKANM